MLQIIKSFFNQLVINSIIKIVFRVAPLYYISLFENSKIAFYNFMLKFTVFFNIVVYDDYNKFPKLRLGVLVLTIATIYLSPNFLKEMVKREFFSKKSNFFKLEGQ